MPVPVLITRLDTEAVLPSQAHPGDAGYDLFSIESARIPPGGRTAIRTGLALALPEGFVALVHPRSGLALKKGLTVANAPGTIDAGYRGELAVLLVNLDPSHEAVIGKGDRIALGIAGSHPEGQAAPLRDERIGGRRQLRRLVGAD